MDVSKSGLFVTGSHDRTAKLWSLERTFPIRIFVGHMSDVTVSVEFMFTSMMTLDFMRY